jgi:hypothetical protein
LRGWVDADVWGEMKKAAFVKKAAFYVGVAGFEPATSTTPK